MKTLRTVAEVRAHVAAARRGGRSVGLVPTMGAFEEPADLAAYPRSEADDAAAAAALGVDALFAPAVEAIYPDGFATTVRVGGLADVLEGAERGASHFDGVCTVVCKLFNIVAPDVAFFGQKDAQQVVVIGRMVRDLEIPVRLHVVPTVREPDGLALSSRNARLGAPDRERAVALSRALETVRDAVDAGERDAAAAEAAGRAAMNGLEPEYLAVVDPETLERVRTVDGRVLVVVAARVGPARLIDNILIEPVATRTAGANQRS
jgi:pantoate--beta-alanine ligase